MQVLAFVGPNKAVQLFGVKLVGVNAVVEVGANKNAYSFDARFKTSNTDLLALIEQKKAHYAVHIECAQTRYRNIFKSDLDKMTFEVPAGMLDGNVEVTSFILASSPIDKYSNDSFHPDYAKLTFRVRKADTLAVGHDHEFTAEKKVDPLRKVPSIFSIQPNDDPYATGMDIETMGNKVTVKLSRANYDAYAFLKNDSKLHPMLSLAVVVPALVSVIDEVRREATTGNLSEYKDRRWFLVLSRRLREIGIDPEDADTYNESSLRMAHEMLGQPLGESLAGLKDIHETE
ncbi:MAG: hypothetical protein JNK87_17135 [Bryobacterales bacterium]|nr:hypothetical protein [Bryobacterales bacterium]